MFYMDYYYIILVIPAMLIAGLAQLLVKGTYRKYSAVGNSRHITGAMAAQAVLNHYGIRNVSIQQIGGSLTDNYNPKSNVISLSSDVYSGTSIAAVGVACHEAGHAAQHAEKYAPILIRNKLVPICNIGSTIGIPLALIGYFLGFQPLVSIGLLLYTAILVFQLVTLPVEFNASKRAIKVIDETGILMDNENAGAKKVLAAAAMTYVASMIVSLANLLRFILRFSNRSRR